MKVGSLLPGSIVRNIHTGDTYVVKATGKRTLVEHVDEGWSLEITSDSGMWESITSRQQLALF